MHFIEKFDAGVVCAPRWVWHTISLHHRLFIKFCVPWPESPVHSVNISYLYRWVRISFETFSYAWDFSFKIAPVLLVVYWWCVSTAKQEVDNHRKIKIIIKSRRHPAAPIPQRGFIVFSHQIYFCLFCVCLIYTLKHLWWKGWKSYFIYTHQKIWWLKLDMLWRIKNELIWA